MTVNKYHVIELISLPIFYFSMSLYIISLSDIPRQNTFALKKGMSKKLQVPVTKCKTYKSK